MNKDKKKALLKIKLAKSSKMKLFSTNTDDYDLALEILDTLQDLIENLDFPYDVNKEICYVLINFLDDAINYEIMENMSNYGKVIANLAKYFEVVDLVQQVRYNSVDPILNFEICLN
jgi:hypothetical protein